MFFYAYKRGDVMKKILFTLVVSLVCMFNVYASEYTLVNKEIINYEINNFYIDGGEIIINGWGIIDGDVQSFINSSTHAYYLYIENVNDKSDNHTYTGSILSADKTDFYKYTTTTTVCSTSSTYNDAYSCYTRYENVGFEFKISTDDLDDNAEYQIYLRIYGKKANVKYEVLVYAPNIQETETIGGIQYELVSDFSTVELTVITTNLFVRSGPDTSLNEVYGSYSACSWGKRLYWGEYITFTTLQETYSSGSNYDSETWFKLLYKEGLCQSNRSRAIMGYTYSGWIASVHVDFSGTPAIIRTTLLESVNVDEIITYTAKSGEDGKISLSIDNDINQKINIKVYYDGDLVVNENYEFIGEKDIDLYFELIDTGDIEIIVTEENGITHEYNTEIFISNEYVYYVYDTDKTLSPDTPIMVIKKGSSVDYIYEEIEAQIPYNYIELSAGSSFYAWALITYSTDNNNVYLNEDIYGSVIFPSQEDFLTFDVLNDNTIEVDTIKTDSNNYQALFDLPTMYLTNPDGNVYSSTSGLSNYINGGRKWYTPINDELGYYDYTIYLENVGINAVTIIFPCIYRTTQTIFGNKESEYVIKRVETPDNVDYIYYKTYYSVDLTYYRERLEL